MVYTEIKERDGRKYYYKVMSVRRGGKVSKKRKYLGVNLPRSVFLQKEKVADKEFALINRKGKKDPLEKIKQKIINVLKKHNVKKAGIFGSYARGEQKKNSDIDVVIEPPKGIGLGFIGIELELESKLKKKVDLLSYNGLNKHLKKYILEEEVRIV